MRSFLRHGRLALVRHDSICAPVRIPNVTPLAHTCAILRAAFRPPAKACRLCSAAMRVHALTDPICSHPLCIQPGPCNMTDCNTTRRIHTTRRVRRAGTRVVATGGARVPARQDTRGTPCGVQADDGHHHREAVIARCGARACALLPCCRRSGLET